MQPHQLIDMQGDLLARLADDDLAVFHWEACARQILEGFPQRPPVATQVEFVGGLILATRAATQAADVFRVTRDMSTVVEYAASQLDDEDRLDPSLAPSGCGLVRFEQPLICISDDGTPFKAHWLLWGPCWGATLLYAWNDSNDPDQETKGWLDSTRAKRLGRWSPIMGWLGTPGAALGPAGVEPKPEEVRKAAEEGRTLPPLTNIWRLMQAFWLLCDQTIADTHEEHIRKTARKQAERLGIEPRVTVVQLRRSNGSRGQGESQVEWTRRWVVKGHWRWQAHGEGRKERKRIWIAPFIKGPEDAPLIASTKVYDLKR